MRKEHSQEVVDEPFCSVFELKPEFGVVAVCIKKLSKCLVVHAEILGSWCWCSNILNLK